MDEFYYLGYSDEKINNKNYLCIHVLDLTKYIIFKIYKLSNNEIKEKAERFSIFEDITEYIDFAIKRDGKISLNINLE